MNARFRGPSHFRNWVEPYLSDFVNLRQILDQTRGFVVLPIQVEGPDVGRALTDWLELRGTAATVIEPLDTDDWIRTPRQLVEMRLSPGAVAVVIGRREPPPEARSALHRINERRDVLERSLGRPLLWCGPTEFLTFTAKEAPDFWSIAANIRVLKPSPKTGRPAPHANARMILADVHRLRGAIQQGNLMLAAELALSTAKALTAASRLLFADRVLLSVLREFERSPDAPAGFIPKCELYLQRAQVAQLRGRLVSSVQLLCAARSVPSLPLSLQARIYLQLGHVFKEGRGGDADTDTNADDLREACEAYQTAVNLAEAGQDWTSLVLAQASWGEVKGLLGGDPKEILQVMSEAVKRAQDLHDEEVEAAVLAATARVYVHLKDRRAAEQYVSRARWASSGYENAALEAELSGTETLIRGPKVEPVRSNGRQVYVPREEIEQVALAALRFPHAPVVLWGSPKTGKTSLLSQLARLAEAGELGNGRGTIDPLTPACVVHLPTREMVERVGAQPGAVVAEITARLAQVAESAISTDRQRFGSPLQRLTDLMEEEILPQCQGILLLVIDDADAGEGSPDNGDWHATLRAWCEYAATGGPWTRFRLVMTVADLPSLLANVTQQSPLNFSMRIEVTDMTEAQVLALSSYLDFTSDPEIVRSIMTQIGGHPHLWTQLAKRARDPAVLGKFDRFDPSPFVQTAIEPELREMAEQLDKEMGKNEKVKTAIEGLLRGPVHVTLHDDVYRILRRLGLVHRTSDGSKQTYVFRYAAHRDYLKQRWGASSR
ncbi:MAG: AAA-like domain-containing protein [Polyangiaceae bacterium]|nr:AAA-like domain-containing protein [Polyangiaceae bacterium]